MGEIRQLAASASISLEGCQIVDVPTPQEAARTGVAMAHEGRIAALMKGSLHSRIFLHELGHHEGGLRTARRMSHVYVLDAPQAPRVLLVSDGAVNIAPDLGTRCDIVQNSIDLAHMLGIGRPRVALLSAVEVVNPDLPSTLDAAVMCKMAERGQITGGVVDGPLALDNAISPEAARCKGVTSPVAGLADILVVLGSGGGQYPGQADDLHRAGARGGHCHGHARPGHPDQPGRPGAGARAVMHGGGGHDRAGLRGIRLPRGPARMTAGHDGCKQGPRPLAGCCPCGPSPLLGRPVCSCSAVPAMRRGGGLCSSRRDDAVACPTWWQGKG
ncbi:bifunctional enoyl-CoA hydratase/phosphate acetyltransferase [Komagataeibacter rhaeticus]|nr:bifunctional enoyl-CoA hydratase/phosphate acetyltransferase [Komagataeibacter rhaeticus]